MTPTVALRTVVQHPKVLFHSPRLTPDGCKFMQMTINGDSGTSQVPQLTEVSWVYNTLKTVKFCEVATDFVDSIQVGFEMDFPDFSTVFVRIPYFTSVRRRFCEDHHWNPQNRWRLHKIGGAHRMAVTLHSVIQPECTQRIISSSDTYLSNYYPFSTVRDQMNAVEGRKEKFDCF